MEFSEEQEAAIAAILRKDNHVRVPASAGSGKTRVLVEAIARLAEGGTEPEKILAVTFTAKAGKVLEERLVVRLGRSRAARLEVGTYHRLARRRALSSNDQPGHRWSMRRCINVPGCEVGSERRIWSAIVDYDRGGVPGTGAKSLGISPKWRQYASAVGYLRALGVREGSEEAWTEISRLDAEGQVPPRLQTAWAMFEEAKQALGAWDFADVIDAYVDWLDEHTEAAEVVLVDEAQDNDHVQAAIVESWAQGGAKIVLVGDSRQSLYGFRGAFPELFLAGSLAGAETQTMPLSTNYRSSAPIVDLGSAIVEGQEWAIGGRPHAHRTEGEPVRTISGADATGCLDGIAHAIKALTGEGREPSEIAVLARTNADCGAVEATLHAHGIPASITGRRSFWASGVVRDLVAYAALCAYESPEALVHVINRPKRYMRTVTGQGIASLMREGAGASMAAKQWAMSSTNGQQARAARELAADIEAVRRCSAWADQVKEIRALLTRGSDVADGEEPKVGESADEDTKQVTLAKACEIAGRLESASAFVAFAESAANAAVYSTSPLQGRVMISTVHRAKGLEWPVVFVLAADGRLPLIHRRGTDIDEERRVAYVAVTRAEDLLYCCWWNESDDGEPCGPSRFLVEAGLVDKNGRPPGERELVEADAIAAMGEW